MPLWAAALLGALIQGAGSLVGQVLLSLGIGYVTYTGVNTSLAWAKTQFLAGMSGAPAAVAQLAGLMGVGVCVSMLLSAVTARLVLAGLTSGTLKRMVVKS